jgi:hypothetical protein
MAILRASKNSCSQIRQAHMEQPQMAADQTSPNDRALFEPSPSKRPRLDVVSSGSPRASVSPDDGRAPSADGNWLSERDFIRTLELVDRSAAELEAAEARARELEAQHKELLEHASEKFEAAQALIRSAEERALRAEAHSDTVEERAKRAEARAREAEQRALAAEARAKEAEDRSKVDREWLVRLQDAIEQFASRRGQTSS